MPSKRLPDAGSILAVLIALTIYDEDVLAVEHVLTTVTLLGVTVTVCRWARAAGGSRLTVISGKGFHLTTALIPPGPLSQTSTWCSALSSCSA